MAEQMDLRQAKVPQLERWANENSYDIDVEVKAGTPSVWTVTLAKVRGDRRKFSHSSKQMVTEGRDGDVEASAKAAYKSALVGASRKLRAYLQRGV